MSFGRHKEEVSGVRPRAGVLQLSDRQQRVVTQLLHGLFNQRAADLHMRLMASVIDRAP
jgi:hypothetical protein